MCVNTGGAWGGLRRCEGAMAAVVRGRTVVDVGIREIDGTEVMDDIEDGRSRPDARGVSRAKRSEGATVRARAMRRRGRASATRQSQRRRSHARVAAV